MLSVRVALASLMIKSTLRLSDEETIKSLSEIFLGLESFRIEPSFNPSLMMHFFKRFASLDIADVQELLHQQYHEHFERQDRLQQQKDNHESCNQNKTAAPGAVRGQELCKRNKLLYCVT